MKLKILFFTSAIVIIPSVALAQTSPASNNSKEDVFMLHLEAQTYPIDASTLQSWQGTTQVSGINSLLTPLKSTDALLNEWVGNESLSLPITSSHTYKYQPQLVYQYIESLAKKADQPAQEPNITIENNKVTSFTEPRDGYVVDAYSSTFAVINALSAGQSDATITATTLKPTTALSSLNSLGINELLAHGVSAFKGSPHNRIHNIQIGVQKMTGVIVAPGEEFSFNKNLGPVEAPEGFLPELVIKANGTVPELGGGLCQVSSTTFRAAMQAGLPITERRNHAYAVSYYGPQGTDATIYPGVVDLKFINDTPGNILIWPYFIDNSTLAFDFWGTKDDRSVILDKPVQFDRQTNGSLKATWTRHVTKDGITNTNVFKSSYASPALYHKQETFVSATGTISSLHVGTQ